MVDAINTDIKDSKYLFENLAVGDVVASERFSSVLYKYYTCIGMYARGNS